MARDFFDDPDYEAIDRQRLEEAKRLSAIRERQDAEAAAESKARVDATSRRAHVSALLGDYQEAGVLPPFTDADGVPTVSLALLKWQGWRIERDGHLVALLPPHSRPQPRRRDDRENS